MLNTSTRVALHALRYHQTYSRAAKEILRGAWQQLDPTEQRRLARAAGAEVRRIRALREARRAARALPAPATIWQRWAATQRGRAMIDELRSVIERTYDLGRRHQLEVRAASEARVEYDHRTVYPYRGAWRSWSADEHLHTVYVRPGELARAVERGWLFLGGKVLLGLAGIVMVDDRTGYARATWLEQARGCRLRAVRGWLELRLAPGGQPIIIRYGRTEATVVAAVRRAYAATVSDPRWGEQYGHVPITLGDAMAAGYCLSGVEEWCWRAGLGDAYRMGSTTVAEVVAGIARVPDSRAVALVRRVVARARSGAQAELA